MTKTSCEDTEVQTPSSSRIHSLHPDHVQNVVRCAERQSAMLIGSKLISEQHFRFAHRFNQPLYLEKEERVHTL